MFCNEEFIRVFTQDRIARLHQEAAKRNHTAPRLRHAAANILRWLAERLEPTLSEKRRAKGDSYVSQP